jgi:DNA-binding NarL/FixJ family response regulator
VAADGQLALDMYDEALKKESPFSGVIMDLTIPGGMGGKETIKKMLKLDPEARVVVSSGYADDPIMAHYSDYGFKAIAVKPYTKKQLQCIMNQIFSEDN